MSARRFRIAFSFAGEKREFVAKVARILADLPGFGEGAILYDEFHQAEFARYDLGIYLPKLYGEQSDLIVPVLCPNYDQKPWTGWEWVNIYSLLTKADGHRVMPCRFEHASADGLTRAAGFIELDEKTPEEAARLILERLAQLEGLAQNEGEPKDHYTNPTPPTGKAGRISNARNLPRIQPFFAREDELKRIAAALAPENRTWGVLIVGPGGMGKTSLAIRAAEDCAPDQFDRIVFISAKDRELDDEGVRALGALLIPGLLEILNELARQLERAEITRVPEDQRIGLLLEALQPARALLILDNLESLPKSDRDQLFTFVKSLRRGCKAILTSRRGIGSGSKKVILKPLGQAAALEVLADLAQDNELLAKARTAQHVALYKQTAGNPLLLRWVVGQLGLESRRTIKDALTFLKTCPPDNDPLEFIFGDLVNEFTEPETKILCALTYFNRPVNVRSIAEVAGHDQGTAETSLASLANRSLVVPDEEEKQFALVPMVADFLRRKRPDIIGETGDRLEQRAYALVQENGYQHHDLFPVLDDAWPTVAAALPRFLAGPNDRLQIVCDALRVFLESIGRWDESLVLTRDAEAKAAAAQDFWRAGLRAFDAGWIHHLRGQSAEVVACADRAEAHWRESRAGAFELALAQRLRGIGQNLAQEYLDAIGASREAVEKRRTLTRKGPEPASAPTALVDAEQDSSDLDAAKRDGRDSAKKVDFRDNLATISCKGAIVALDRKDWPSAEAWARGALVSAENIRRQELIALANQLLAQALIPQGRHQEALPRARGAVAIFKHLRSPRLEAARAVLAECERRCRDDRSDS